jgi:hypothetical protein
MAHPIELAHTLRTFSAVVKLIGGGGESKFMDQLKEFVFKAPSVINMNLPRRNVGEKLPCAVRSS